MDVLYVILPARFSEANLSESTLANVKGIAVCWNYPRMSALLAAMKEMEEIRKVVSDLNR
jgi:hypothetical protein